MYTSLKAAEDVERWQFLSQLLNSLLTYWRDQFEKINSHLPIKHPPPPTRPAIIWKSGIWDVWEAGRGILGIWKKRPELARGDIRRPGSDQNHSRWWLRLDTCSSLSLVWLELHIFWAPATYGCMCLWSHPALISRKEFCVFDLSPVYVWNTRTCPPSKAALHPCNVAH